MAAPSTSITRCGATFYVSCPNCAGDVVVGTVTGVGELGLGLLALLIIPRGGKPS